MAIVDLKLNNVNGKEIISIELDDAWLQNYSGIVIDPDLYNFRGRQYPPRGKTIFGFLADSAPDRWGRMLIERREITNARKEKRQVRTLNESDYLLCVHDEGRVGGLRYINEEEIFLDNSMEMSAPPIAEIRELEHAAVDIESGKDNDDGWIQTLIAPGSSLGGARPKANVMDTDNTMWIAKFPSKNDVINIGAWEKVAHDLSKLCGIRVPESRVYKLSQYGDTFAVRRFDREISKGSQYRIHFASAMTMLGKQDGESSGTSYLDLAEIIEEIGSEPSRDLNELWNRMVFNILISNTDDHLRNHGFLLEEKGWILSPAFDVNPTYDQKWMSLYINEDDNTKDIRVALSVSDYFRVTKDMAIKSIEEMQQKIKGNWSKIASRNRINREEQKLMELAFSECDRRII